MPSSITPLPGLTRYTWWGAVPEGLFTKTQFDRKGLKSASDPVGHVLYHGNCYAPLYERSAAVPKRRCSPAQRALFDRARELQYVPTMRRRPRLPPRQGSLVRAMRVRR